MSSKAGYSKYYQYFIEKGGADIEKENYNSYFS